MKKIVDIFQLLKFILVGTLSVTTDFIIYKLLVMLGVGINISKSISYLAGGIVGFCLNKRYTFKKEENEVVDIVKYIILCFISGNINMLVNRGCLYMEMNVAIAFLCATSVSTCINFVGQKFIVFRSEE